MLVKVNSAANYGIKTVGVDVEVNVASKGFPTFDIVGLPDKAVAESKERVKTAIQNSGLDFPDKKITVNLAPADLPKEGSFYDLPIAVGIISALTGFEVPKKFIFYGELSLDGGLRHTKGSLLISMFAKENGFEGVYMPFDCANEAGIVSEVILYPTRNIESLYRHLMGELGVIEVFSRKEIDFSFEPTVNGFDMSEILGQEQAKRALEIAAAGGHNTLLLGPPGGGKTMLAKALPTILPPLSDEEALEVTKIHSAAGVIPPGGSLIRERQCKSPHHTISYAGLIGGGTYPKPGEISLAHRGVLFLDEFAEFPRYVLETLRQPMEDGIISISRSSGSVTFPSRFILIAASNPCPCGYFGHPKKSCSCSEYQIERYRKKISGPILDRIDLHVDVRPVEIADLNINSQFSNRKVQTSKEIREKVIRARKIQEERFKVENILAQKEKYSKIFTNTEMKNKHLSKYCTLSPEVDNLLKRAVVKFNLSARAYFKIIKVARTIADLSGGEQIGVEDMGEALQYRVR